MSLNKTALLSAYNSVECIGLGHLNLSGLEWMTSFRPSQMKVCSEPQMKIAEFIVPCKDSCSRYLECRDKVEPE
uniref:Uncharacterized protein n=1 Tax=Oryza punctata TaxID=4537 RepID=A0A0E0LV23_ORYPU